MVVRPVPARTPTGPGPVDDPPFDRRRSWLILGMVVAFMMINYADKSVLGLAAVPLMDDLGIGKSTYGLVSSAFYVLFSVTGLVVGLLSARWSTRTLLLVMAALWAVAQLPALLASVPALIAGRLLLGAAEGPAASMSMHALYAWFPPGRRGMPSALQIGGAALGTAVSAPILTWLIVDFGWRSAFVALAVTSAAWCALWYLIGRDGPYAERPGKAPAPTAERPAATTPPPPLSRLLRSRTVVGGILSAFGSHWALALSSAWLPVYLRTELDMTAKRASGMVSAVSVLSLVLLLTVPALLDRRRRRGRCGPAADGLAQGGAVLVSAAALAPLPFASSVPLQLALIAVAFACHSVALPLHYVTTAAVVPAARRGAVFGVVAATGTLPGMFVPYLTGRLVDGAATETAGYAAAFLVSALVLALCGAVATVAVRPGRDARALGGEG
ncbi:MFS transporter [Streptomyces sp. JW3]|uniref:MFS transporter n=1 Tax=Streptomyces sp. JW3 TaxID=3456955 RepID=UPI003FA4AD3A